MTFDASDFALGPEDEEAEGRLANGAARQDVAVTAATPPATGAIAPQVAPRAISVVRESEALSPRLKEQGAAALHGGAHLSPKALSRATERPLLHDEPSRTVGSESLRELRATVARHEQLIEAQRRAIIGLEGIVSRLVAHDEANGGGGHQGAAAHARGSTAAFVQATQQPSGAVAKPDASPRKPAASQPRAPAASSGRGLGGGSALGGSALPYEKRLSCVTQQSVESAVALGRASPPRRLSEDAAHNVVRYSVRGRHVSTYGPTHPSGAVDAALAGQPPELAPSLDYVYGYRAHVPGLNVNNPLVVVSPDVVVYAAGRLCVVLDSATNSQAFYGRHEEDVLCVAAAPPAPDGTIYLASGELGRRPGIHIWALAGCEPIAVLSDAQHERGIGLLAFSPDGAWLASVGLDNHRTLVIWDWARQAPLASIKVKRARAPDARGRVTRRARRASPIACITVRMALAAAHCPRQLPHPPAPTALLLPPPPAELWCRARLPPNPDIACARRSQAHNEPLFAIGFNPTDSGVLSIVGARAYKLFKLEQPPPDKHPATHVASISAPPLLISKRTGVFGKLGCGAGGQPQTLLCLAYRSDGLAATGCASGDVLIWRGQEVEAKLRGAHEAPVYSVAVMADGHMVTGDRHGLLALWDSSHAHVLSRALDDRQPEGCELPAIRCLAPLGARAAQLEGASGYVEADFGAASWSVLIGCSDGSIREIALSSGVAQVWMQAHGGGGAVTGLATDPTDAARFASCSTDRTVRVWSAEQRWPISQCTLSEETCSVDWGPRGDVLAVGLLNGSVLVLKADSLEPHASVKRRNVSAAA